MTSPFATLFLSIQARLKSEVPELQWIDQELGQLEAEYPPVDFPCALIDTDEFNFEDWAENIQNATGFVKIRLAGMQWNGTNQLTPNQWKKLALFNYELEWKIFKALHGWKPDYQDDDTQRHYNYLLRVTANTEPREDNMRVRLLRFSCGFYDDTASPIYQTTTLKPPNFL